MRVLLDTHVWIWWVAGDDALASDARDAISDPRTEAWVSAASVWEVSIKRALGKLVVSGDLDGRLEQDGLAPLMITVPHASRAGELPQHHGDPFDRMLVAQAQIEDLTLVTRDPAMTPYGVPILAA